MTNFLFHGRMDVADLPNEAERVAKFLEAHHVTRIFSVRLNVRILKDGLECYFNDRIREEVEVIEVPPLMASLSLKPPGDIFVQQRYRMFDFQPRPKDLGRHQRAMWRLTGPDRGPAMIERLTFD